MSNICSFTPVPLHENYHCIGKRKGCRKRNQMRGSRCHRAFFLFPLKSTGSLSLKEQEGPGDETKHPTRACALPRLAGHVLGG